MSVNLCYIELNVVDRLHTIEFNIVGRFATLNLIKIEYFLIAQNLSD